ncbi:MAG: DUF2145 domain-containing protein [Boseongicola sp.]|nr:MAG: DUF2145 domain-containing protein [Boseongicola sp.]
MKRIAALFIAALVALMPAVATAGSSEAGKPILSQHLVAQFSNRVQKDLAARGAHVAIVARTGRDPKSLPQGVRYTHLGFWVYSDITLADGSKGRGYNIYNLYQLADDKTRSRLVQDTPADFFAGAQKLDAGIIIPDVRLQQKLLNVITSPTYSALHNAKYSVLANPDNMRFQNCTEHTLDVLMASLYGTSNRAQIKANINAHFDPQVIRLGGLKRAFAPVASQALTTSDHGSTVATATFSSIARFMKQHDLTDKVYRITPQASYRIN